MGIPRYRGVELPTFGVVDDLGREVCQCPAAWADRIAAVLALSEHAEALSAEKLRASLVEINRRYPRPKDSLDELRKEWDARLAALNHPDARYKLDAMLKAAYERDTCAIQRPRSSHSDSSDFETDPS